MVKYMSSVRVDADYTLEFGFDIFIIDTSSGNINVTVPATSQADSGREFYMKNDGPNNVHITLSDGMIDGMTEMDLPSMACCSAVFTQGDTADTEANYKWYVLHHTNPGAASPVVRFVKEYSSTGITAVGTWYYGNGLYSIINTDVQAPFGINARIKSAICYTDIAPGGITAIKTFTLMKNGVAADILGSFGASVSTSTTALDIPILATDVICVRMSTTLGTINNNFNACVLQCEVE